MIEGTNKWFDTLGVPNIPRSRRHVAPEAETTDTLDQQKVLGHAYMDTVNDVRQSANLGATAFDALMIRSAIESA